MEKIEHTRKNYGISTKYDGYTLLFLTPAQRNEQLQTGRYESDLLSNALMDICKRAVLFCQFGQEYGEIIDQLISHGGNINFKSLILVTHR
jgi:hypothetical protein